MEVSTSRKIADNLSWLGVQEVFARLSGILLVVVLARNLSTSDYGSLNICLALIAMLSLLVRSGTGSRAVRLTARDAQNITGLYWQVTGLRFAMALVVSSVVIVLAQPISTFLSVPPSLLVLSVVILLRPALTVAWAFRGLDNRRPIALSVMIERALVFAGVLLLLPLHGITAQAVILLEILAGLAVVVFLRTRLDVLLGERPPLRLHPTEWGAMFRESLPISLAAMTASLYRYGDLLLLGLLAGSSAAALYIIPHKVVMALLIPAALIGAASFPSVSRIMQKDTGAAVEMQARLFRMTLVVLLPACALAWFYATELLALLFGGDYSEGDIVLKILLLSVPLFAYATFQENLLLAAPRPRAVMTCRVFASAVHIMVSLLLIPTHGIVGAAIGCLIGQLLFAITSAAVWKTQHGRLPLQSLCSAPVAASGLMLFALASTAAVLSVWQSLIVAALLYLVSVVLLRGVSRQEARYGLNYILGKIPRVGTRS